MGANPKLYRELQQPFTSQDEAQKASSAFQDELAELRKKHRMRDLLVVAMFSYGFGDGEVGESESIICSSFGDPVQAETMAAYALGTIQSERQHRIGQLLKGVRVGRRDD